MAPVTRRSMRPECIVGPPDKRVLAVSGSSRCKEDLIGCAEPDCLRALFFYGLTLGQDTVPGETLDIFQAKTIGGSDQNTTELRYRNRYDCCVAGDSCADHHVLDHSAAKNADPAIGKHPISGVGV
jgi:hypothetical protein